MSKRTKKSWTVFVSIENAEHDRCVDIFLRADGSYGFEELRRDFEDGGRWTPLHHYSHLIYASLTDALDTAERRVPRPEAGNKDARQFGLVAGSQEVTIPVSLSRTSSAALRFMTN
jgi:hypothetical protein